MTKVIIISPDGDLTAGTTVTVTVTGGTPNSSVTVEVDDGGEPPQVVPVTFDLNESGTGSGTWGVPDQGWDVVHFTSSGAQVVSRVIVQP